MYLHRRENKRPMGLNIFQNTETKSRWSMSCGVDLQRTHRSCSNPYTERFGDHCFGDDKFYRSCSEHSCTGMYFTDRHTMECMQRGPTPHVTLHALHSLSFLCRPTPHVTLHALHGMSVYEIHTSTGVLRTASVDFIVSKTVVTKSLGKG